MSTKLISFQQYHQSTRVSDMIGVRVNLPPLCGRADPSSEVYKWHQQDQKNHVGWKFDHSLTIFWQFDDVMKSLSGQVVSFSWSPGCSGCQAAALTSVYRSCSQQHQPADKQTNFKETITTMTTIASFWTKSCQKIPTHERAPRHGPCVPSGQVERDLISGQHRQQSMS